ncbi:MAG: hypothetical protein HFH80_12690 [Lachnospiraceae bacterium]|nr:hypothetical protein [Lachnospiraceae bacterium]
MENTVWCNGQIASAIWNQNTQLVDIGSMIEDHSRDIARMFRQSGEPERVIE